MNDSAMPSPQEREAALFALAIEKPVAERPAFLQAVCGPDQSLRRRLESLLAAHDQPDTALVAEPVDAPPTVKLDVDDASDEAVGQTIGRYKLLERVGEGGCGVVYVAEQTEPVRRRVALKVIKLGMDTKQVVARFEAERQALAMMDHPNIAKVLDAGSTEKGRPYFVMELVRGIRITDYCDQNNLSTQERLDLFIKVCQAIQHAHQKGIIHRDIKPSNILVTLHDGVPVPKVIDFGIAKATEGRLTDATVYTQLHQFIGTPAYMSPEQAEMSGLDIDTRSDIYSLGVLLYELLVGSTPFDAKELLASGIDAMRKTIREEEPVRPSTRLATLGVDELTTTARRRSADTAKLLHQLRGDLDWIVMKCLEKDRTRRYETANGLAQDLKRHLNHEPVVARPPSTAYRVRKFVQRNRAMALAGTGIALALFLGLGVSIVALLREHAAREDANSARLAAEARKTDAEKARALAEETARLLRIQNYVADMRVTQQAINANDRGEAITRLRKYFTAPGAEDLRGFEWRYLWQQAMGHELLALGGHDYPVPSALFSPDGQFVVSMGLDGKILVHRTGAWSIVARISGGHERVWHHLLAFSPDGKLLAAQGPRGLMLIDTTKWTVARELEGTFAPADFSADGRLLGAWSDEGVKLWNTTDWTSKLLEASPNQRFAYCTLRFAPNSRYLALSGSRDRIQIWDVIARRRIGETGSEKGGALTVQFSADSRRLAFGMEWNDGSLVLWDIEQAKLLRRIEAPTLWTYALALSPDGKTFASAAGDQVIRLWNAETMELQAAFRGHEAEVWSVTFSPDGRQLLSASKDGTVRLWPVSPPSAPVSIPLGDDDWWSAHFNSDSTRLTALQGSVIHAWRLPDGQPLGPVSLLWDKGATNATPVRASTGQLNIGTRENSNGTTTILDLETGRVRGTVPSEIFSRHILIGPAADFCALIHVPSRKVKLWDLIRNRLRAEWPLDISESMGLALSPDGKLLARATTNYIVVLHDTTSGATVQSLVGPKWNVSALAFSPDGHSLAAGSWDAKIYLWDIRSGRQVCPPLSGHRQGIAMLEFSPDGRTLISSSDDITVRLWNVQAGQELLVFENCTACTLSPAGDYFGRRALSGELTVLPLPTFAEAAQRNQAMMQALKLNE